MKRFIGYTLLICIVVSMPGVLKTLSKIQDPYEALGMLIGEFLFVFLCYRCLRKPKKVSDPDKNDRLSNCDNKESKVYQEGKTTSSAFDTCAPVGIDTKKEVFNRENEDETSCYDQQSKDDMPFSNVSIKANSISEDPSEPDTFELEAIKGIPINDEIKLRPYDASWYMQTLDADCQILSLMANTPDIKKYLPNLDFSTIENSKRTLRILLQKTEMKLAFTYMIRSNNMPIGMIVVNSPKLNKQAMNISIWTIDFFLVSNVRHNRIMAASLFYMMDMLKSGIGVKKLYMLTDETNTPCLNLIGRLPFVEVDNSGFKGFNNEVARVFVCDLEMIDFVKE